MDTNIITYIACICFLFIFGRVFIVPITKVMKLVINSTLGGLLIFIINLIGANFGFHIGLNFFTSILVRNIRITRSNLYCNYKIIIRLKKPKLLSNFGLKFYSTVTDFAKFLGLSTSNPFSFAM